jgi:hypothetical protein
LRVLAFGCGRAGRREGRRRIRHPDDELAGRFLVCASSPLAAGARAGVKDGAEFVTQTMN